METSKARFGKSDAFANPPRTALERLITAVSVHGADPNKVGGGGVREMTAQDWMAALSGSGDPIGEELVAVKYLDKSPKELQRALHLWGTHRLIDRDSDVRLSAQEHRQVVALILRQHLGQRMTRRETMAELGMGNGRYEALKDHWVAVVTRLVNGESRVLEHLKRRIRH